MFVQEKTGYKSKMVLHINKMNHDDYNHKYFCIAKNDMQKTVGEIQVYGNVYIIEHNTHFVKFGFVFWWSHLKQAD